ncbi:VirK family protein [Vibrio sp. PP-XX7]
MKICQLFKVSLFTVLTSTSIVASAHNLSEWDQTQAAPYYTNNALQTANAVVHALNSGATVNATVDLSLCTRQDGGTPSTTKGGLRVSPFRIQGMAHYRLLILTLPFRPARNSHSCSSYAIPLLLKGILQFHPIYFLYRIIA